MKVSCFFMTSFDFGLVAWFFGSEFAKRDKRMQQDQTETTLFPLRSLLSKPAFILSRVHGPLLRSGPRGSRTKHYLASAAACMAASSFLISSGGICGRSTLTVSLLSLPVKVNGG